jgi:hypothetical protein
MTTLTALFGAIQLSFEQGTGPGLRSLFGTITLIDGLLQSQLLKLYTTPVINLSMGQIETHLSPRQALQTEYSLLGILEPLQWARSEA